jgi:hypothetical protein
LFANRAGSARDTYFLAAEYMRTVSSAMLLDGSGTTSPYNWLLAFYACICSLNLSEAVGEAISSEAMVRLDVLFAMVIKV